MLVLLSGVSGAGKDTIKKELIERMDNVESLPSFTDRAPRENDIPGKTYNFVSTEEFEAMIARGELYEYSAHHNHYYGTSRKLLNEKMQNGKIIVKDIEVNGVENLVGTEVEATDLRGGAGLVIAGLSAEGETTIKNISHIERGYDKIEEKIQAIGGKIYKV